MDILKILTPEQIKSLTEDQLKTILGQKKNNIPRLKALFLNFDTKDTKTKDQITTEILEILLDNLEKTFYIIPDSYEIQSLHDRHKHKTYKLYTEEDICTLIKNKYIEKILYCSIWHTDNYFRDEIIDPYIQSNIISKTHNLKIISKERLFALGHFKGNLKDMKTMIS